MNNHAYENAQNRTTPRGTAEYRKARQERVLAYKAREIYEATYSDYERMIFERWYAYDAAFGTLEEIERAAQPVFGSPEWFETVPEIEF